MVSSLTRKWLAENTANYSDPNLVMAQVVDVLDKYPNLRPKLDVYTYDDGRSQLLLCVHGLLPIQFRGATYNIPVALWLPILYPRHVPIAYVVPTSDMLVKAGKYVDVSGRCEIEYMRRWERKFEGCNLVALAEAMQEQFSKEPPLYAKPKPTIVPAPTLPSAALSGIDPSLGNRPPPPLPAQSPPPPPVIVNQSSRTSTLSPPQDLVARPPPPLPRPNQPPSYIPPPHYHSSPGQNRSTPVQQHPGPPPVPPAPPLSPTAYVSSSPSLPGPPPPPPPPPPPALAVVLVPPPKPVIPNLLDEPEASTSSLGTSSPPPRPLNPHLLALHQTIHNRIHSSLQALSNSHQQAAQVLTAQQTDLLTGEPAIRDEMARLEAVGEICRSSATKMKGVISEAEGKIAELQRRMGPDGQGPSVDELICGTSIVHNQLIELVAEDNAIEDTIYHLHRALSNGRLDLERFLRTTRVLAEEQFMKRALIERIQTSLNL